MNSFDSAVATLSRSVPSETPEAPGAKRVGNTAVLDAREPFAFKQVFLTKGADGNPKELVFALEVKDPAEANMAAEARKAFLKKLKEQGKVISYFDIRNMKMTYPDGTPEAIPENDENIKILRGVYERVARAREQIVSWPSFPKGGRGDSNGPKSFASISGRIHTMNNWPASTMIEKLGITDSDKKKRGKAILDLREKMLEEPAVFGPLHGLFAGTSRLALAARAAGVGRRELETAIRGEPGEKKEGFIEGRILQETNDEITSGEKDYLTDIELLSENDRLKFIQASLERKRPVTQDSLDHALLAAFDAALTGEDLEKVADNFCKHPLIAASGLEGGELGAFKTKFKTELQEMVRNMGSLPGGAHAPQAADLDPID